MNAKKNILFSILITLLVATGIYIAFMMVNSRDISNDNEATVNYNQIQTRDGIYAFDEFGSIFQKQDGEFIKIDTLNQRFKYKSTPTLEFTDLETFYDSRSNIVGFIAYPDYSNFSDQDIFPTIDLVAYHYNLVSGYGKVSYIDKLPGEYTLNDGKLSIELDTTKGILYINREDYSDTNGLAFSWLELQLEDLINYDFDREEYIAANAFNYYDAEMLDDGTLIFNGAEYDLSEIDYIKEYKVFRHQLVLEDQVIIFVGINDGAASLYISLDTESQELMWYLRTDIEHITPVALREIGKDSFEIIKWDVAGELSFDNRYLGNGKLLNLSDFHTE